MDIIKSRNKLKEFIKKEEDCHKLGLRLSEGELTMYLLYKKLLKESKPLDPKIQKMVNENFWDLI